MYRVLIAEDEEIIRRGVCNSLSWEEIGCEIVGAVENGAEAIEWLKQASPDLLLCDIRMPEVSGLDVARFIYENKIDCKVILLTGYNEFSYAQQAITCGVFDYLLKPVSSDALKAAIDRAIHVLRESAQKRSPARAEDATHLLTSFVYSDAGFVPPQDSRVNAARLAAPQYAIAVVLSGGEQGLAGKDAIKNLLTPLFENAAAQTIFRSILPEKNGLLPLCIGYSSDSVSDFFCWEVLKVQYFQQTHSPLMLASAAPVSDLCHLHASYEEAHRLLTEQPVQEPVSSNPIVKSVRNYLWEHYAEPIKLSDVADHTYLNPSYISRVMRKETGIGFVEQLLYIRVQKAKLLLLTTSYRTFEIAEQTGFGSVKYFCQVFRQYTQMSPGQYRTRAGVSTYY